MTLSRLTPTNHIQVLAPRWHDRKVLIAKYKVGLHNTITFSNAPSLPGEYYMSGEKIKTYPLASNGKLPCYAVNLDDLEILERA